MEASAKEVSLPDDDPDTLLILLHIAHLKFDLVTGPRCFSGLLKLAVLCDKYDTVKLVRPWLWSWLKTKPAEYCRPRFEEWLFIAWTLGLDTVYMTLAKRLIASITIDTTSRLPRREGMLLDNSSESMLLSDNMPPGAIGGWNPIQRLWYCN